MTNYPTGIDNNTTLPLADGYNATSVNALIGATEAIELELGIVPAGVYVDVRTRLDILEARINNPNAPAPDVLNPFFIGNTGVTIQAGFGDPNIVLAVPPTRAGDLFLREDGYVQQTLYVFATDGYWYPVQLNTNGSVILDSRTITGNYTVDSITPDYVILCNASAPINIQLTSSVVGRQLIIKDISTAGAATNNITILPSAGQKIDNASNFIININKGAITITGDGSGWWII
jgi:hypothetical protein